MDITLLCIGDVVGKPGRHMVSHEAPRLVRERGVDVVIANVENAAGGSGLTPQLYDKFLRYGVNVMTMGDHVFRRAEIVTVLQRSDCLIRPANLSPEAPGRGMTVFTTARGPKVAVISVMGRLFMNVGVNCPFHEVDRLIASLPDDVRIIVVDMHAEATGEKVAMGWHLDGRASVVFGTHTHVPTADERILPKATAYISDLGMTGPHDSVLGRRTDRVLGTTLSGVPSPFDVAVGDPRLNGILVRVDSETGRAAHIERVRIDGTPESVPPDNDGEGSRSND
ncbi:MAG: TIGR00282 family metallophosphoesterase [Phycisphaerae bacterium]